MEANPKQGRELGHEWDINHQRWKRLLDKDDPKLVWKSINWSAGVAENTEEQPDNDQFRIHFENLLNPPNTGVDESLNVDSDPYIPVLDDPFTVQELDEVVKDLKKNKSYIGICPTLFSLLP